jgi:phosphatidylinositol glycan class O
MQVLTWELCSLAAFYATGHRPEFNSLQFAAAFIGFDEYNFLAGVIIIGVNTWVGILLFSLMLPSLVPIPDVGGSPPSTTTQKNHAEQSRTLSRLASQRLFLHTLWMANSMASTYIQRRHLMVWRVFAPKYVFDGVGLLLVNVCTAVATLLWWR